MEDTMLNEGIDILKKLSLKNQTYFMTLLRLAEVAEEGAKSEMHSQLCKSPKNTMQ